jgi:thymidylate synthase
MEFKNAEQAFHYLYSEIHKKGIDYDGTKALFNVGFYITNPLDNNINLEYRKLNKEYAEAEWKWYLTGDRNIDKLGEIYGKVPTIWRNMANQYNEVNSNYGWQWLQNSQLDKVINKLLSNKETRQATISIYDGKQIDNYYHDTPCTYAITFNIVKGKLNMSVLMRSNDLWFGFCNDQYCFSKLQELVSKKIDIKIGTYYHHATNLHIYNNFLNKHYDAKQ